MLLGCWNDDDDLGISETCYYWSSLLSLICEFNSDQEERGKEEKQRQKAKDFYP
jgi:hypothetical protein